MTNLIHKELNRCAGMLSGEKPGSEGYEKLLSCIERLGYIAGFVPAGVSLLDDGEQAADEPAEAVKADEHAEAVKTDETDETVKTDDSAPEVGNSAAPEAEAAEGTTEPEWTKTAVREVLAEAKLAGVSVASILPRFNATRLSEVDPSRYGELVAAVRQEMT